MRLPALRTRCSNGEAYLALVKNLPENLESAPDRFQQEETKRVVIIDMFEEDKVSFEF